MDNNNEEYILQKQILEVEKQILEGDTYYEPNPKLTEMRCNFKHKNCRKNPMYTDGINCYCWIHSIMIQWDKYK